MLALKDLPYESRLLDWDSGELRGAGHLARSPFGQVPCLEVGGRTVCQSVAIAELLEELHPEPAMLPEAPLDRAAVRELVEAVNAGIQPLHNGGLRARMREQLGANGDAHAAWSRYWLERRLGELEPRVAGLAGHHAYGDRPTLADVFLYPQLCKALDYEVALDGWPSLARLHADLSDHPAFAGTEGARLRDT